MDILRLFSSKQHILRLLFSKQHKFPSCTLIATQQQPLSRLEKGITITHLSHHLQKLIKAHESALHSRTPVNTHHLHQALISHPDQAFVTQLVHNLEHGCAFGYSWPQFSHSCNNLSSSFQQPCKLDNVLSSECSAGCKLWKPTTTQPTLFWLGNNP